jgi:hypothetical protein
MVEIPNPTATAIWSTLAEALRLKPNTFVVGIVVRDLMVSASAAAICDAKQCRHHKDLPCRSNAALS